MFLNRLHGQQTPRNVVFSTEHDRRTLADDAAIIDRIIAAYHAAIASAPTEVRQAMHGGIWGADGFMNMQRELIVALETRSPDGVHRVLKRLFIEDAGHGIAMGRHEAEVVAEKRALAGVHWLDRLVATANAVGAAPVLNPEDSGVEWPQMSDEDVTRLVDAIEQELGIALKFPDQCAVFGGEAHGAAFPHIAFSHLCVAHSLRSLTRADHPRIAEIGGGFGGLCYWVQQLVPACRYTIFDLPSTAAMQAYFLSRALPGKRLWLFGEPAAAATDADVALYPAWALLQGQGPAAVDVAVNQDSLPEIPTATAVGYLRALPRILRGPFLSVNHESPARDPETYGRTSVANLVKAAGGFTRLQRCRYFLRVGYVQELYYPADPFAANRRDRRGADGTGELTPGNDPPRVPHSPH